MKKPPLAYSEETYRCPVCLVRTLTQPGLAKTHSGTVPGSLVARSELANVSSRRPSRHKYVLEPRSSFPLLTEFCFHSAEDSLHDQRQATTPPPDDQLEVHPAGARMNCH